MVMPGMRGDELAARVLEARPATKVVFMSGYTEAGMLHHEFMNADTHFIQKPVEPTALAQKVREVLDAP
jgi:FixJ family two-component response regulator